ncbi:secreted RxLR effector protein 161-like [Lucilia sericata]|uniref:secreted RxLR effector protein 161-like n=1 Tax=Lucilia sericata TaxID=13632 RepID=UPI0018A81B72|nr:secreted RxLR effector protein 161-like [Lucilia sericata]
MLVKFGLQDAKSSKYPLEPSYGKTDSELLLRNDEYQSLLGSLLYIAVNTRPDICASVAILARKTCNPNQEDWNELKRVAKYLKGTRNLYLNLSENGSGSNLLVGYADANWAECRIDRKSNSGYIFLLNNSAVSWACKKQTTVSLSTTEAEFIALSEAAKEAVWIRNILNDLNCKQSNPTVIFEDNRSCLNLIKEEKTEQQIKTYRHKIPLR